MSKKISIKEKEKGKGKEKNEHTFRNNVCGQWIRFVRLGFYDKNHPKISQDTLIARLQSRGLFLRRSSLSRIETGRRVLSDIEVIFFAEALRVSVTFLYEGPGNKLPTVEELSSYVAEDNELDDETEIETDSDFVD